MKKSIYENAFFAFKLALKTENHMYWDVIRKIPLLPGASGEIIEILTQCLNNSGSEIFFLIDFSDFYLAQELSALGAVRTGYLTAQKSLSSNDFNLWAEDFSGSLCNPISLHSDSICKRAVFRMDNILHSPSGIDPYHVEVFFKRDRVYWGISESKYDSISTGDIGSMSAENKFLGWQELAASRKSASEMSIEGFCIQQLEKFLNFTLYEKEMGRFFYGNAGGISSFDTFALVHKVDGLTNGLYFIDSGNRRMNLLREISHFSLINEFLFLPQNLINPPVTFFFVLNLDKLAEKYGTRALRFSLLSLGGALQQLNLTATNEQLNYRSIGGFDEIQVASLLGLRSNQYIGCAAILGN